MRELVKRFEKTKQIVCPNGHTDGIASLNRASLLLDMPVPKFCVVCGSALVEVEEEEYFPVSICSECKNAMNYAWHYCPYCGAPEL